MSLGHMFWLVDKDEGYSVGYLIGLLGMHMGFFWDMNWGDFLFS